MLTTRWFERAALYRLEILAHVCRVESRCSRALCGFQRRRYEIFSKPGLLRRAPLSTKHAAFSEFAQDEQQSITEEARKRQRPRPPVEIKRN